MTIQRFCSPRTNATDANSSTRASTIVGQPVRDGKAGSSVRPERSRTRTCSRRFITRRSRPNCLFRALISSRSPSRQMAWRFPSSSVSNTIRNSSSSRAWLTSLRETPAADSPNACLTTTGSSISFSQNVDGAPLDTLVSLSIGHKQRPNFDIRRVFTRFFLPARRSYTSP